MLQSEACTLQYNTTIYGKIITAGKLVVKAQYLCSIQVDNNWYWNQHPQDQVITVPKHTVLHPRHEVIEVTYFHTIPKCLCNRTQEKNHIKTAYMFD